MYRLRGPVRVQYRAAVGTTANGEVLIGVDYDAKDSVLTYQGTAALSPKSMTPVWKDSTLAVPHNRAMKQRWLVTASDISPVADGSAPSNFRDDAVAFGLNITSTGTTGSGSIWVEYNVEFASPRQPEPPVNASINVAGTTTKSASLTNYSGTTCPVDPGQSFYIASTAGSPSLATGYTQVGSGTTDGVNWTQVARAMSATSDTWGSYTGNSNTMFATLASASLAALTRAFKRITIT